VPDLRRQRLQQRSVVLVGIMGAGKTSIGRRLASRLGLPFVDADLEIEKAAGQSVADIFEQYGEAHFREGEKKVIARLLESGPQVLATGGGAFVNEEIRANIAAAGVSVWLKADFDTVMKRVRRRSHRPLLQQDDPEQVMKRLIDERYPVYATANITVRSRNVPHEVVVEEIVAALDEHLAGAEGAPAK
jgi:shikimate kinase